MSYKAAYEIRKNEAGALIEKLIADITSMPPLLKESLAYSLSNGGKRIRPVLFLECYKIFGGESLKNAGYFACAIECIHTYSLIHDDLPCMDNDDFRRGLPTNHKVYGEGLAVLAGDALLNLAYELCFKAIKLSGNDPRYIKAACRIAELSGGGGLIGGQSLDIKLTDVNVTPQALDYIYKHKTSDLIKAAMYSGAVLGGADDNALVLIEGFADNFGYAFQIQDDILDFKENKASLIKNYIDIFGLENAENEVGARINAAIKCLEQISADTSFLKAFAMSSIGRSV